MVEISMPPQPTELWRQAEQQDTWAKQTADDARQKRRQAVAGLLEAGFSHAEAAQAPGVSRQRIGQLAT
jgi:uncharacterized membrane protein